MKTLFIGIILAFALAANGLAAVTVPLDERGNPVVSIDFVGANFCNIAPSTGTRNVQCFTGRGVVLGYAMENDAAGNFVTLFDSASVPTVSSFTVLYASGAVIGGSAGILGQTTTNMFRFPVAYQVTNGLSATANATVGPSGIWTIFYRPFTSQL